MLPILLAIIFGGAVALLAYGVITLIAKVVVPYERKYVAGAEQTLDGMFLSLPVRNILYLSLGLGVAIGVLMYFISGSPVIAIGFAIVGFVLPRIVIGRGKKKRDERFLVQLADALLSLSNSLKTGYSVPQAINLLAREMDNPARQEFRLVAQEMQLGTPLEEALGHLAERMESMEMDLTVASVAIARQVGGNLSEIMENIAGTIRERLRVEGRVKALTAQGRIQGIVMCLMPFALGFIIYLVRPDFIRPVFTTWAGYLLIAVIIAWMALGAVIVRKVVSVEI
ncbi:MAG: type II secretion system F family protein [Planctomycetota bacterium]